MAKILVMTDIHITKPEKLMAGLDSLQRFEDGLEHAARMHPDAERLVIMGDLVHAGTRQEYERLASALKSAPWPISYMLGNHDNRRVFLEQFPDCPQDENGFIQSVVDLADTRLIMLDSLDHEAPIKHAGRLCEARLGFLKHALETSDKPCMVFVHHMPFITGFSGMDAINLLNADDLIHILKGSKATHLFAGHIHRHITASIQGISMTTFKSTCHQMPMILGEGGSAHSVDEPGAYGIILTNGSDVVVHFEDFTLPNHPISQDSESGQ